MLPDLLFKITAKGAYAEEFGNLKKQIAGLDPALAGINRSAAVAGLSVKALVGGFAAGFGIEAIAKIGGATVQAIHEIAAGTTTLGGRISADMVDTFKQADDHLHDLGDFLVSLPVAAVGGWIILGNAIHDAIKPPPIDSLEIPLTRDLETANRQLGYIEEQLHRAQGGDPNKHNVFINRMIADMKEALGKIDTLQTRIAALATAPSFSKRLDTYFDNRTPFDNAGPVPDSAAIDKALQDKANAVRDQILATDQLRQQQADSIKTVTKALGDQAAMLGMTAEQQRVYTELEAAGTTATTVAGKAIVAKVHQIFAYNDALALATQRSQAFTQISTSAFSTFTGDLEQGKTGAEAFRDTWVKVIEDVIQKIEEATIAAAASKLFGAGGVGTSLVSSVTAALGFATGGSFTVGGSGGPDSQFVPLALSPGEIVSIDRADRGGSSGSGGPVAITVSASPSPYFDLRVQQVSAPLAQKVATSTVGAYDKAQRRGRELAG